MGGGGGGGGVACKLYFTEFIFKQHYFLFTVNRSITTRKSAALPEIPAPPVPSLFVILGFVRTSVCACGSVCMSAGGNDAAGCPEQKKKTPV